MYAHRPFAEWVSIVTGDWTRSVWGSPSDEMRSMLALAFWWDGRLWPFHVAGYHFTNVLVHAGTAVLVFLLARTIFAGALGMSWDELARATSLAAEATFGDAESRQRVVEHVREAWHSDLSC